MTTNKTISLGRATKEQLRGLFMRGKNGEAHDRAAYALANDVINLLRSLPVMDDRVPVAAVGMNGNMRLAVFPLEGQSLPPRGTKLYVDPPPVQEVVPVITDTYEVVDWVYTDPITSLRMYAGNLENVEKLQKNGVTVVPVYVKLP